MNNKTLSRTKEVGSMPNVANDEWSSLINKDLTDNRFRINKKPKFTDIEVLAKNLQEACNSDDKTVQKNLEQDSAFMLTQEKTKGKRGRKVILPSNNIADPNVKVGVTEELDQKVDLDMNKKEEVVQKTYVHPQTTKATASSFMEAEKVEKVKNEVDDIEKSKVSTNRLLRLVAKGFAHLYIKNTADILKPLAFVAENFQKVFYGMLLIILPLIMTKYLTSNVEFIALQINQQTLVMSLVSKFVFYIACAFLLITGTVIGVGLLKVIKNILYDVAKIGKENK